MYKSAIVALAIAASVSWIAPAQAFPVTNVPITTTTQSDVTQVDWHGHRGGHIWRNRGGYRGDRYYGHHDNYSRRGYYGYRHHGGNAGAIIGGLAAGAIIGGALSARPHYGSHASSCANRYRTYRASDNTYQPSSGPRRQCR